VRLPIQPGVRGAAEFSACGRYRHWLSRCWRGDEHIDRYVLWIGMNPSTAESNIDDPTIRKEMKFTRNWGFDEYIKVNVMDLRATNPKNLIAWGSVPCSNDNFDHIRRLAGSAALIVAAWGTLPKPLRNFATSVELMLRPRMLLCVGTTKDGSPRHPLYVRDATKPIRWR
jgi:hypothetical protein